MSTPSQTLYHSGTNAPTQTWEGFSWPCLAFGIFWFCYKGMYLVALAALVVAVFTGGITWFIFPFFANKMHREWLANKGYVPKDLAETAQARCPECRELVRSDARKCKHCGSAITLA